MSDRFKRFVPKSEEAAMQAESLSRSKESKSIDVFNKSFLTNALGVVVVGLGYISPVYQDKLLSIGYFALSGSITNWLAIYMLFEKVPGLYGSGVIPSRFEEFKIGIKGLIMGEFFTQENIERFFREQTTDETASIDLEPVIESIDYDEMFKKLVSAIMSSPFAGMITMMGGEQALMPVKEPFAVKMREAIYEMGHNQKFQTVLRANFAKSVESDVVARKVEEIVQRRLDELTPNMVKEIVQDMIRQHLGWLVVWGGVLGGLLGLLASFAS